MLINEELINNLIIQIDDMVKLNYSYSKNLEEHGFTTPSTLFNLDNKYWQLLKESFLSEIKELNPNINFDLETLKAWCYVSFPKVPSVLNWHIHSCEKRSKGLSGIFYLQLPKTTLGHISSTTEFKMNDGSVYSPPPVNDKWIIFNNDIFHRPGLWEYDKVLANRYVIAASIEYDI
jgi:hypothetical protein